MTCAITPAPTTPTLSRSVIGSASCIRLRRLMGSGQRGLDQNGALLDPGLRVDKRILVLDRERPDRGAVKAGDELAPPCSVLAVARNREVPRHLLRSFRPPVVEQAVETERILVEGHVLGVYVADARHDPLDDSVGIHLHPEEVAGIEVGVEVLTQSDELLEGFHVVDCRAWVELDADLDVGVLLGGELRELGPVGNHGLLPLTVVHALQIREPAPRPETPTPTPRGSAGATKPPNTGAG